VSCTSGCATRDHSSYADCLRNKRSRVGWAAEARGLDATGQKRWQGEIDAYRSAVAQGMDPDTSQMSSVRQAEAWSNQTGIAYTHENATEHRTNQALERI